MKKIFYTLLSAGILLAANLFASNGTFQIGVETPTPSSSTAPIFQPPALTDSPAPIPPIVEVSDDPYGELYFTIIHYPPYTLPPEGADDSANRPNYEEETEYFLMRLPGSCVMGLIECPAPENVPTPFDMQDALTTDSDSGALIWSPDGRYGAITIHPADDFTEGWTAEDREQFRTRKLEDLDISPSTLYLFDAATDTWRELYRAERKFFYSAHWSPDGEWIAFIVASSLGNIHPTQADDGVYIVHPDGSGLQRLGGEGYILGWVGDSILTWCSLNPTSDSFAHVIEKLGLDGQATTLFQSDRLVSYALAPDGGSLLAADAATREGGNPLKAVNVLALDGTIIRSFGTFPNSVSAIYPFTWSLDGSQVAFANLRRLYVAPRAEQLDAPTNIDGVPSDVREAYLASDEYTTPWYSDIQFSRDNKFLLAHVYGGFTYLVVVSLETGESAPLTIPHLDPFVVDDNYLGDLAFFSWRQ